MYLTFYRYGDSSPCDCWREKGQKSWPFRLTQYLGNPEQPHMFSDYERGCFGWVTKLVRMSEEDALAVFKFAVRANHGNSTRVTLFYDDGTGYTAGYPESGHWRWQTLAEEEKAIQKACIKRGKFTLPDFPRRVPKISREDFANFLRNSARSNNFFRAEAELAMDLKMVWVRRLEVNGHKLLEAVFQDCSWVLPADFGDQLTTRAIEWFWNKYRGKFTKVANLWHRSEMHWIETAAYKARENPEGAVTYKYHRAQGEWYEKRELEVEYPVCVYEVFMSKGRYVITGQAPGFIFGSWPYDVEYFCDEFPWDRDRQGWDFAKDLHQSLSSIGKMSFNVSAPIREKDDNGWVRLEVWRRPDGKKFTPFALQQLFRYLYRSKGLDLKDELEQIRSQQGYRIPTNQWSSEKVIEIAEFLKKLLEWEDEPVRGRMDLVEL